MNIWIFNHYAVGPNSNGITRHYDLARNLVELGHTVTIFASSFNHQSMNEERIQESKLRYKEETYEGVNFVWIKTFSYKKNNWRRVLNMFDYTVKAYSQGKKRSEDPDVVIGSLAHPLAALVGQKIAHKKKALFYFEERDLWPQSLIDLGKMSAKNPVIKILAKLELYLYKKADKIIVLFDKASNYVKARGISEEKIVYLPNGVDFNRVNNSIDLPIEIENEFNKVRDKKIAIYTGTLGLANNIDLIIDSAAKLQNINDEIHFMFIGGGPQLERLKKRLINEKINNVTFIPPVKKEYIYEILSKADMGLLPLQNSPVFKWGISPNKLYDYSSKELPVLLFCNLDDTYLENENAGIVFKNNFKEELVNYLSNIDSEELSKMGENGKIFVKKEHDWHNLAKKIEAIMITNLK